MHTKDAARKASDDSDSSKNYHTSSSEYLSCFVPEAVLGISLSYIHTRACARAHTDSNNF